MRRRSIQQEPFKVANRFNPNLTPKQRMILKFMWDFYHTQHQLPNGPAICNEFRFKNRASAYQYLDKLTELSLIERNAIGNYKFTGKGLYTANHL